MYMKIITTTKQLLFRNIMKIKTFKIAISDFLVK